MGDLNEKSCKRQSLLESKDKKLIVFYLFKESDKILFFTHRPCFLQMERTFSFRGPPLV